MNVCGQPGDRAPAKRTVKSVNNVAKLATNGQITLQNGGTQSVRSGNWPGAEQ